MSDRTSPRRLAAARRTQLAVTVTAGLSRRGPRPVVDLALVKTIDLDLFPPVVTATAAAR